MEHELLVGMRLAVVAAGLLAALWSFRLTLHSRDQRGTYLLLTAGFSLVTLGSIVEGILFEFVRWDLVDAHTMEAAFGILGFALVLFTILRSRV